MSAAASPGAPVAGIVLAAGGARRFGSAKQLARFADKPLLEHALAAASAARLAPRVVVLGFEAGPILECVDLHGARPVVCERWSEGQAASLIAGIDAIGDAEAAVITLGDQPLVSPVAIEAVVASRSDGVDIVQASYGEVQGHPVLLERAPLEWALRLTGDQGARALFAQFEVRTVRCDGLGSPVDVDTPEQLATLEAAPGAAMEQRSWPPA